MVRLLVVFLLFVTFIFFAGKSVARFLKGRVATEQVRRKLGPLLKQALKRIHSKPLAVHS